MTSAPSLGADAPTSSRPRSCRRHPLAFELDSLKATTSGTPLCRFHSFLLRQRSEARPFTTSRLDSSAGVTLSPDLLPMHLPARPTCLDGAQPRSRRRAQRLRQRKLAYDLADWLIAIYSFYSVGSPKSEQRYRKVLGDWHCTSRQCFAHHRLVEELLQFSRLQPKLALSRGRGIKRMDELLSELESAMIGGVLSLSRSWMRWPQLRNPSSLRRSREGFPRTVACATR